MLSNGIQDTKVSKFSIAKERVLQKLGAHEKSKDQAYYESKEKIARIEGYCADISSVLNLWLAKVQELSAVSSNLAKVWLRVYEGTNERMEKVAHAYCNQQQNIQDTKVPRLADKIQKFTDTINNYRSSIDITKEAMESRRKLQLTFDHYNSKFTKLKGYQEKNRVAGKLETLKERERFERNLHKLSSAKESFLKANQTVIKTLHHHWESRFGFLDNLFKQIISNETMFFEAFTRTLGSTKPVLHGALKKSLPKPSPPPTQAEINELNNKAKYGNQTLFDTAGKAEESLSSEYNPGEVDDLQNTLASKDSPRNSKLGSIFGKAKNIFVKSKDLSPEPGTVQNNGREHEEIKSLSFEPDMNLSQKQKKKAISEPGAYPAENSGLTLDDSKGDKEHCINNRLESFEREIDPKDPFAIFDSSSCPKKRAQKQYPPSSINPVPSLSNPFSTLDKEKQKSSPGFYLRSIPKSTSSAAIADPFANLPENGESLNNATGVQAAAAEVSDPFSSGRPRRITPNPFADEESETDGRKGEPSPDPFASLFK